MKLYFADPLFSEAERTFNLDLTYKLEALGFTVFLPQRDGVERDRPPYDTMPAEQKRRLLFETDRDEVLKADVFLYVLDGRVPDEGAAHLVWATHADALRGQLRAFVRELAAGGW